MKLINNPAKDLKALIAIAKQNCPDADFDSIDTEILINELNAWNEEYGDIQPEEIPEVQQALSKKLCELAGAKSESSANKSILWSLAILGVLGIYFIAKK